MEGINVNSHHSWINSYFVGISFRFRTWDLKKRRKMPRHHGSPAGEGSAPLNSPPTTNSTSISLSIATRTAPSISVHRPTRIYRCKTTHSSPESWTPAHSGSSSAAAAAKKWNPTAVAFPRRMNLTWRTCARGGFAAAPRRRRRSRRRPRFPARRRRRWRRWTSLSGNLNGLPWIGG